MSKMFLRQCVKHNLINQLFHFRQQVAQDVGSLDNYSLYMHPITYDYLASNSKLLAYVNNKLDKIFGLDIKIDNYIAPFSFIIKEDKGMNVDRDSIEINYGGRNSGITLKTLNQLPKKYIINQDACILFWSDGNKTIVKRADDDIEDPVKGFLWAYFQKHSGLSKTKANKYLREIDEAIKKAKEV